jgi:hypothetical protein
LKFGLKRLTLKIDFEMACIVAIKALVPAETLGKNICQNYLVDAMEKFKFRN